MDTDQQTAAAIPATADATVVVAVSTEPQTPAVRVGTPAEQALIRQFEDEQRVPSWLRTKWATWKADREFLAVTAFALADGSTLGVNLAARAIQSKLTRIAPSESDLSITQKRSVGSVDWARKDAIRAANQAARRMGVMPDARALIAAADQAEQAYRLLEERRERFGVTNECLLLEQMRQLGFTDSQTKAALSTFTVGLAWTKDGWQRDPKKDASGCRRWDTQDDIARLQMLAQEYSGGWFDENSAKWQQFLDLSDNVRNKARQMLDGQIAGDERILDVAAAAESPDGRPFSADWLAEPDFWQQPTTDHPRPENMRWDWRVLPQEAAQKGDWIAEQVLMDRDRLASQWKLSPQEARQLGTGQRPEATPESLRGTVAGSTTDGQEPGTSDYESASQGGKCVLWDRFDFANGRHYMWAEGLTFFLVNEPLPVTDETRCPYECLAFNQFDGEHLPTSEVTFLRKIQTAINQRLTDGEESLWASMKRYIVKKGAFKPEEMDKLRSSVPHDVIECEDPKDIRDSWQEIASDDWNAEKYNLDQLFRLLELVMGMSLSELGVVQVANTATEANIAEQRSAAASDRHAIALSAFGTRRIRKILGYDIAYLTEKQVQRLTGSDQAIWPMPRTREELLFGLNVDITVAGNKRQARGQEIASINGAIDAIRKVAAAKAECAAVGIELDEQALVAPILRLADVRGSARELMRPKAPAPMQASAPIPPPPSTPSLPAPQAPQAPPVPMPTEESQPMTGAMPPAP